MWHRRAKGWNFVLVQRVREDVDSRYWKKGRICSGRGKGLNVTPNRRLEIVSKYYKTKFKKFSSWNDSDCYAYYAIT